MYLSKLDIVGFKSFAQKTNLRFTTGISAIVGPNGCGKSNIVDAIRWVLGEQKTSVLRSDVMENVIFNGTKHRKPLGMAEVAITIENNKNILPSEYNEVVITRRLFRSGDSEYLLNNTKCRLRDIVDLFMDTGLGSDSYSVIELKMVEAILSGKTEDRRGLFEEAAGIKKYKLQRKEATKKLNDVLNDLLRVNDLVEEIRKNVNSLQRHAQKTRRYNVLNEEFRTADMKLSAFQFNSYNVESEKLQADIKLINDDKLKNEILLNEKKDYNNVLKIEYQNLDNDLNAHLINENEIEKKIGQAKQEIAVSNERLARINDDEGRLKLEIDNTTDKLGTNDAEIIAVKSKINELETISTSIEKDLATANQELETAKQNTINARKDVTELSQNVQSMHSNINQSKNNIYRDLDKKKNLTNKIAQFDVEKQNLEKHINEIEMKLSGTDTKLNNYIVSISEKENLLTAQKEKQNQLSTEIEHCKQEISKLTSDLNHNRSSYNFLDNLIDTSETAKFLINSSEWTKTTKKRMLSESIAFDENLQSAISVLFSNFSDYFIANTAAEAQTAISLLRKHSKGKAGFICLDTIPEVLAPSPILGDGIIGWFSEIVRTNKQICSALRLIFKGLIIVEDYQTGVNALANHNEVEAAITLSGEYLHKSGAVRGGSFSQGETARFGKIEKMNKISEEITVIEAALEKAKSQKNNIEHQLSQINTQILVNDIRNLENEKRNFENETAQLKLKKTQFHNNLELIEKNCENYKNDISEIENEVEMLNQKIAEYQETLDKLKTEFENKQTNLTIIENNQKETETKAHEIDISLVKTHSNITSANNDLKRLLQQEQNYYNSIENRKLELIRNKNTYIELEAKINSTNIELAEFERNYQEIKNKSDFLAQRKKSVKEQTEQIETEINDTRKIYDRIIDSIHQKELKLSETNTWLRNITLNFQNNYQLDIANTFVEIPAEFSENEAKQILADLKQKLQNLGSINFAAIEEYETEKTRLEFLERQVADLTLSEKTLRETIDEINLTAERNFTDTFKQIRDNFQNLFRKLFNEEGEADIKYDENNPLESDINIIARPPNKRPNSIEQLSGGEKTLTAIALLFAIYLVKPSPFCILDEVDAPLDDANVRRFLHIIREFSRDTQFLIVTHNKTTMTAADTLYGVTMQEPGVSKTASVRIDEIED